MERKKQKSRIKQTNIFGQAGAKIGWAETGDAKGRGVFARENINKGALIECQPAIVIAAADVPESGDPPDGYLFDWDPETEGEEHCMPLGLLMLYNHHSKRANVRMESDFEAITVSVYAIKDIKADEELLWDYSCEIWFDEEE